MSQIDNLTWKLDRENHLVWRAWDDESVVYDLDSGDTHHLNLLAALALQKLSTAHSATSLASLLAAELQIDLDPQFTLKIEQLLRQFDELGLISPA